MHQQIRTVPKLSPPDLEAFLTVLADAGINIEAAGGSDVEQGGEFAFAVAHGQERDAMAVLEAAGYLPRLVDVQLCALTDEPGQLLACITEARALNASTGMVIKDISIGRPDADGRIQVQIYSEAV
jgi:hypothetical protein